MDVVLDVVKIVPAVLQAIADGLDPTADCGVLKDGQQYYIQSRDGRFAVVDGNKQAAYMMQISASDASKFTAVQKSCDVYGLCINGFCMSRCEGCISDTEDFETVKFHINNSDGGYSQWKLTLVGYSVDGGAYNLQVDDNSYLTYKETPYGGQLTLSTELNDKTTFVLIEAY